MNGFIADCAGDSLAERNDSHMQGRRESPTLPTEIWAMILTMVIDPYGVCYDYCTSFDSPLFFLEWDLFGVYQLRKFDQEMPNLRLVCHLWSNLIKPTWRTFLRPINPERVSSYTNIRALYLNQGYDWNNYGYKSYPLDQSLLEAARNINTLVFRNPISSFDEFLFLNPGYFQNVRSFYFFSLVEFPPNFWMRLENALPRLTALSVTARGQEGKIITLPHLKILHIGGDAKVPAICHFPCLIHFTTSARLISDSSVQILGNHGKDIESLLLRYLKSNDALFFGGDFWARFPKLKVLGADSSVLDKLSQPSVGHPFHHLYLNGSTLNQAQNVVASLPGLRYLSICLSWVTQLDTRTQTIISLDEFVMKRGAKRLEIRLYGRKIRPELDRLRKHNSWPKVVHRPDTALAACFCMWELN